jgi:hypothetical protein
MERWLKSGSLKQCKDNVNPPVDLNQDDAATEETEPLLQQSASTSSSSKRTQEKDLHVKQLTKNTATSDIVKKRKYDEAYLSYEITWNGNDREVDPDGRCVVCNKIIARTSCCIKNILQLATFLGQSCFD